MSLGAAHQGFYRAVRLIGQPEAQEYRDRQLARLALARAACLDVLARLHVHVSGGQVVRDSGEVVEDDGPVLAAVDRLLKVDDQEARLLGLYPAGSVQVGGTVRYVIEMGDEVSAGDGA